MAIKISCPACAAKLKLAAPPAPGKKLRCAQCQERFFFMPAAADPSDPSLPVIS